MCGVTALNANFLVFWCGPSRLNTAHVSSVSQRRPLFEPGGGWCSYTSMFLLHRLKITQRCDFSSILQVLNVGERPEQSKNQTRCMRCATHTRGQELRFPSLAFYSSNITLSAKLKINGTGRNSSLQNTLDCSAHLAKSDIKWDLIFWVILILRISFFRSLKHIP